jgi:hypothetical protein
MSSVAFRRVAACHGSVISVSAFPTMMHMIDIYSERLQQYCMCKAHLLFYFYIHNCLIQVRLNSTTPQKKKVTRFENNAHFRDINHVHLKHDLYSDHQSAHCQSWRDCSSYHALMQKAGFKNCCRLQ